MSVPVSGRETITARAGLRQSEGLHDGIDGNRVRSALALALSRARTLGRPVLVSIVQPVPVCDPLESFESASGRADERFYWSRPETGQSMVGAGAAWTLDLHGPRRFADAAAAWRGLCADALIDGAPSEQGTGPLLFAGFGFDPLRPPTSLWRGFPDGRLVLPRMLLTRANGRSWLTLNAVIAPNANFETELDVALAACVADAGTAPEHCSFDVSSLEALGEALGDASKLEMPAEDWRDAVAGLVREIERGDVQKVVLARAALFHAQRRLTPAAVLQKLSEAFPQCFVFAAARGERCFLGASPERLVQLQGGTLRATCLAGSSRRGATPAEDLALEQDLLDSAKERAEHAIVVRALLEALDGAPVDLQRAGAPSVMKMSNVQHLFTPIEGTVRGDATVLDFVARLHPTPAVGGYPREAALAAIREHEALDRGWYAGPIGWLDARGDGEFAVAIRSALIAGSEAVLFAGCGIVAGSEPAREYTESCLKMRAVRAALEECQP